ncbi:MAG: PKD domain-containing protein [Bacteroidota bacterium]
MLRVINWCIQLGIVLVCLQFRAEAFGQCSSIIDLNAWTEQGPPVNGTWNVNPTGTTVTQTINSFPTFFVSPQEFINVRITGTLQSTGTDDDFIGFAIGYRNPLGGTGSVYPVETWLFDWKRGTQTVGGNTVQLGQYLSQINGNFDLTVHSAEFWGHQSQNGFNVVASNTGPGTAWAVNAVYNFELTYLSSRLVIAINSDTIFDVPGCFEPGRFGFYNYSQGGTVYANFAYELIPDFTMNTFSVCLGDSAEFQYVSDTCSSSLLTNSVVGNWRWDFGDGDTSALASPAHLYDTLGTYDVTLVVTDNFGCQDSVTRPVTVNTCALPVSYHYFEVRAEGPAARLEWETFSEVGQPRLRNPAQCGRAGLRRRGLGAGFGKRDRVEGLPLPGSGGPARTDLFLPP